MRFAAIRGVLGLELDSEKPPPVFQRDHADSSGAGKGVEDDARRRVEAMGTSALARMPPPDRHCLRRSPGEPEPLMRPLKVERRPAEVTAKLPLQVPAVAPRRRGLARDAFPRRAAGCAGA